MCDWEDSVRAIFTGEDDQRHSLVTPGIPNNASNRIDKGFMLLQAAEILPIFDPVIEKIENLVQQQVAALASRNLKAKAIVLVGGLGCNKYLAKRLRQRYGPRASAESEMSVEIQQPDSAWESVAFGAVKCELLGFGSLVPLRIARYNVGFTGSSTWVENRYLPEQKYRDEFDGQYYAAGAIKWALRRNAGLQSDKKVTMTIVGTFWEDEVDRLLASNTPRKILHWYTEIIASDQDNAPRYPTAHTRPFASIRVPWDVTQFSKDHFPLRRSPAGRLYRSASYDIEMQQNMAGMKFILHICGQRVGELADVEFHLLPDHVGSARAFSMGQALAWWEDVDLSGEDSDWQDSSAG